MQTMQTATDSGGQAATGFGFDLSKWIKLPTVNTAVELSNQTKLFIGGCLVFVAIIIFKPRLFFK